MKLREDARTKMLSSFPILGSFTPLRSLVRLGKLGSGVMRVLAPKPSLANVQYVVHTLFSIPHQHQLSFEDPSPCSVELIPCLLSARLAWTLDDG